MRQKSRILVIALAIIGASMALDGILVIAAAQAPPTPPTTASVMKGTETVGKFLECINDKIKAKGTIDISDTVDCIPGSCTVTLTMSNESAQSACGDKTTCQLPRVILKCPGPPQVEFTYLLCGTNTGKSKSTNGVIASNRVEIGVVVGSSTSGRPLNAMLMADVPIPPGTNTVGTLTDVLSTRPPSVGNKGCNESAVCHRGGGTFPIGTATLQLSERTEVFGKSGVTTGIELAPFIIYTDDGTVTAKLKALRSGPGSSTFNLDESRFKEQALCEICKCIEEKLKTTLSFRDFPGVDPRSPDPFSAPGTGTTKAQAEVVLELCKELDKYQRTRGLGTPTACIEKPTVITLSFFSVDVVGDDGAVLIEWETASEIDNAEFNLYRAKTKDGRYKKINDTLIAAQGNAVYGASYSFVDRPPANGTYYYKLEDVDYYGVSTLHGPVKVRVRSGGGEARRR